MSTTKAKRSKLRDKVFVNFKVFDMTESIDIEGLLTAFKTLGGNEYGKIDYKKIMSLLINKCGLTKHEATELLEGGTFIQGEELDYLHLCSSILTTKAMFDQVVTDYNSLAGENNKIDSRTFTRKKGSARPLSAVSKNRKPAECKESQDTQLASLKGCFFSSDPVFGLSGSRFLLVLTENTPIEITAQAIDSRNSCSPFPAIEVLMFQENDEPNKKLVTFSSSVTTDGYCCIKMSLKRGKYLLVPVSLNWKGTENTDDLQEMIQLAHINNKGEAVIMPKCQNALRTVFDYIDLDGNGFVSQSEFDLFIQHICGETAADEWSTVEDNFDTHNGELTFDGFMALYSMALVTDMQDVCNMFRKMGFSNSLSMEKGLQFLLIVTTKVSVPEVKPLPVLPFENLMEEVFRKTAMEQGYCSKIRNMKDLLLYIHKLPQRATVIIQNQSHSKVKIRLDCRDSENCLSHRPSLDFNVEVLPQTSVTGHHLFPSNYGEPWSVHCVESLIE